MNKLQHIFGRFIGIAMMAVFVITHTSFAQQAIDIQQPVQGAQMSETEVVQPFAPVVKDVHSSRTEKSIYKIPQVVPPANATKKQVKQIAKLNEDLSKVAENQANGDVKKHTLVERVAAQVVLKKVSKKIDKIGVEKTNEIKKIQEAASAKALDQISKVGVILAIVGLLFLLIPQTYYIGLVLLIVGLVLLLVGLID